MTRTISIKKYLRIGLFSGLFIFIIFYTIIETKTLARGVDIVLTGIQNGQVFEEDLVILSGAAKHANHLTLNGRPIPIDKENNFTEELLLSPGYNIITLEALDRFDKKTLKVYEVFYKESPPKVSVENNFNNDNKE